MYSSASSGSDSEGISQYKKLKTEPNSHRPSLDERRKPDIQVVVPDPASASSSSNSEPEQILEQTELKPTEQIVTDAAVALALQMENVDNTYAALFTVDDQPEELSANEEMCSDGAVEIEITSWLVSASKIRLHVYTSLRAGVARSGQPIKTLNDKFSLVRKHRSSNQRP